MVVPTTAKANMHSDLNYQQGDRVADRYLIEEKIGKGGMGVVYRAHDQLIDETVALKFMNPRMLRTSHGQNLFIQEAQIARRLRHENIVAVHDVSWTNEGILYLSMEFAKGESLRSFLRLHRSQRKLIDIRLCVAIITQVLSALENAHRTVIHRDIKPENVMLLASERVKVLDFGLAKAVQEEMIQEAQPTPKKMVGTLAYAAPEQRMKQSVDLRADIYSVGLLAHELVTLRTPLDESVTIPQVRSDVAPSVLSVLEKALREEKTQRWQSAGEYRQALEKAFDDSYRMEITKIEVGRQNKASTENMVHLEGGRFLMGNNDVPEEAPEEEVYLDPFWMDIYPVTVVQYQEFLDATKIPGPKYLRDPMYNGPNQPIVGVNWAEAKAYAEWAGKELPTEAQWEFAARGKENRRYPWGNLPPAATLSNFGDNLGMPSMVTMHDEGRTPQGIYDLAGNIMEWTLDPYAPYKSIRRRSQKALNAPRRIVRGGCWNSEAKELVCTVRRGLFPESHLPTVGFRCVLPGK
jgi:formylglycine-generating enzyme required for sulfatase activity/tRNA A-37 threonylcarbamoyl transferase component Bud32